MGEAGPEAIMPLKRGANGALGVQVSGGAISSPITVDMGGINIVVQGSADGGTAQQVKDAADVIRKQLAKELPEMIVTAQRNRRVA
jgi:phage-related minor tail protein